MSGKKMCVLETERKGKVKGIDLHRREPQHHSMDYELHGFPLMQGVISGFVTAAFFTLHPLPSPQVHLQPKTAKLFKPGRIDMFIQK